MFSAVLHDLCPEIYINSMAITIIGVAGYTLFRMPNIVKKGVAVYNLFKLRAILF